MFDNLIKFFKKFSKEQRKDSKDTAKERLHLVLMQDRANVSADYLEMMKQEIIEVIKKYIDVDENSIDVKLTNKVNPDGTTGAPALYANIPIISLKDETKKINIERKKDKKSKEKDKDIEEVEEKIEDTEETTIEEKEPEEVKEEIEKVEEVVEGTGKEETSSEDIVEEEKEETETEEVKEEIEESKEKENTSDK